MANGLRSTAAPKTKVVAATGGAAIGSSVSLILLWIMQTVLHISMPDNVHDAFNVIFTTVVTGLAGYYTPPGENEGVVVEDGKVRSALRTPKDPG